MSEGTKQRVEVGMGVRGNWRENGESLNDLDSRHLDLFPYSVNRIRDFMLDTKLDQTQMLPLRGLWSSGTM